MARPGRAPALVAVVAAVALLGVARVAERVPLDRPEPSVTGGVLANPLRDSLVLPPVLASGTIEVLDRLGPWRVSGGDVAALVAAAALTLAMIGFWRPVCSRAVLATRRASTRSTRAPPRAI